MNLLKIELNRLMRRPRKRRHRVQTMRSLDQRPHIHLMY